MLIKSEIACMYVLCGIASLLIQSISSDGMFEIGVYTHGYYHANTDEGARIQLHANNSTEEFRIKDQGPSTVKKSWWLAYQCVGLKVEDIIGATLLLDGSDTWFYSQIRVRCMSTGEFAEFDCPRSDYCKASSIEEQINIEGFLNVSRSGEDEPNGHICPETSLPPNQSINKVTDLVYNMAADRRVGGSIEHVTTISDCLLLARLYGSVGFGFKEGSAGLRQCDVNTFAGVTASGIEDEGWTLYMTNSVCC